MDLGIEDFKQLLFDLYLAQRENALLHAALAQKAEDDGALVDRNGEVI